MTDGEDRNHEFSVVEFYADGTHLYIARWLDAESAVKMAKLCCDEHVNHPDIITKIIITDGGDFTVFEWQPDKGVTWPLAEPPSED